MKYKKGFITISLLIVVYSLCEAQDSLIYIEHPKNMRIEWTGEIPDANKKLDNSKKLMNYIFGKNSINLKKPIALISTNNNILWITDQGSKTLIKADAENLEIPRFINKNYDNFASIIDLCLFTDNNILFTESQLNTIFLVDLKNKNLTELNKTLELKQPTGIVYSKITNEIWVVETAAHRISVLNEQGERIKIIGKRGTNPGDFNFPTFIWVDKFGTIYVVDSLNFRIQIFDKTGSLIGFFGEQGDGSGNFARPKGIAVDSYGNIYIVDALFHAVQIFDKSGTFLYSFGSLGRDKGQFWMPTGIYIDEKDNIYVADSYNSRIQSFKLISE